MGYGLKFAQNVAVGIATHVVTAQIFQGVRYLSGGRGSELLTSVPTPLLMTILALGTVLWACVKIKGGSDEQHASLGRPAVIGLIAIQYLGIAVSHWQTSLWDLLAVAISLGALVWLFPKYKSLRVEIRDLPTETSPLGDGIKEVGKRGLALDLYASAPEARPGLILFLSYLIVPPGFVTGKGTHQLDDGNSLIETDLWKQAQIQILDKVALIKQQAKFAITNEQLLEPLGRLNIRMPLEAIRYQLALGRLTHIAIIPSSDTPQRVKDGDGFKLVILPHSGSYGQAEFFCSVVESLFGGLTAQVPQMAIVPPGGVDFEVETQISKSIAQARDWFTSGRVTLHHLDVTGGQTPCSIVGAINSLANDERCQYISTRDYRAVSYNFVASSPPELG